MLFLSELQRPGEYATVSAAEQESATDSIREIESRQDEVLRELDLLEQRLVALLLACRLCCQNCRGRKKAALVMRP